jgi:hypothetical protein
MSVPPHAGLHADPPLCTGSLHTPAPHAGLHTDPLCAILHVSPLYATSWELSASVKVGNDLGVGVDAAKRENAWICGMREGDSCNTPIV